MIHLNNTPIFLDFLQRTFDKLEEKYYHNSIVDEFFIFDKCSCNQSDCATVILKKIRPWRQEKSSCSVEESKGHVLINILDNEYIEVECIMYKFPHKYEINKVFNKNGRISKSSPAVTKSKKKISYKDKLMLDRYFNAKLSLYEKKIYGGVDYRAFKCQKLFQHVRV